MNSFKSAKMNSMLKSISNNSILIFVSLLVISTSVLLGLHNATLYNHTHGFDGTGHYYYIEYIYDKGELPEPSSNWETHQPPLYYLIGAGVMHVFGTMKSAQYINTFVLWAIIGISGLGLWRVFQNKIQTLIGMLSLAALPMLNIFTAMITNELLSTFWILSALVAGIYVITEENKKKTIYYLIWMFASIIFGWWTKVSIILIIPSMLMVLALFIHKYKKDKKFLTIFVLLFMITVVLSLPSLLRIRTVVFGIFTFSTELIWFVPIGKKRSTKRITCIINRTDNACYLLLFEYYYPTLFSSTSHLCYGNHFSLCCWPCRRIKE